MDDSGQEQMGQDATDSESDSGKTALINSDICPGMNPGDTMTLTIDKVLDSGEYQVSYMPEKKEESMEESMAPQSEVGSYME